MDRRGLIVINLMVSKTLATSIMIYITDKNDYELDDCSIPN